MATEKRNDEAPEQTDEERTAAAMGRSPKGSAGADDDDGGAVPAAGADPDSVRRVVAHLPEELRERTGLGAETPEELSAQRDEYGRAARGGRPGRADLAGLTDEEKAAATGQPIGDGKSTGAPSADDPDGERDLSAADARAAEHPQAQAEGGQAGESKVSSDRSGPRRAPTKAAGGK